MKIDFELGLPLQNTIDKIVEMYESTLYKLKFLA